MDPNRIAAVVEWPVPQSIYDVHVFLGFANYPAIGLFKMAFPVTVFIIINNAINAHAPLNPEALRFYRRFVQWLKDGDTLWKTRQAALRFPLACSYIQWLAEGGGFWEPRLQWFQEGKDLWQQRQTALEMMTMEGVEYKSLWEIDWVSRQRYMTPHHLEIICYFWSGDVEMFGEKVYI